MAKLGISTGIAPNDGLGDSLLDGAIKINSNFSEIYSRFGNGTNLTSIGGTWVSTSVGIHTLKNVGIGTTNPTSKLTVTGDSKFIGIVTATTFSGSGSGLTSIPASQLVGSFPAIDGSALTGLIGVGAGVVVKDSGSTVGIAGTIDFGDNLTVSPISVGVVTVSGGSSQFVTTAIGIHTLSNVGIGTTNPTSALTVKENTSLETLSVSGVSTFAGITTITGTTLFTNQLNVSGVSTFAGITTITGTTLFTNQLNVSGVSTFAGITTITGTTLFTNQLNVSGVSTFVNIINASGGLKVTGVSTFVSTEVNFDGNIILGNTSKASDTFVRVLSGDNNIAGIEAYGNSQGTGFLFVGESSLIGGGVAYNGNGVPAFATGETTDTVAFYRKNAGTNEVVFSYPNNSNTVTFRGSVSANSFSTPGGLNASGIVTASSFSTPGGLSISGDLNVSGIVTASSFSTPGGLSISGDLNVSGIVTASDFNSTSDENLKYDIKKVENSIHLLNEINGVKFKWKSNNKSSIGVIAQEVEKVFPELISNGEVKSINYNGLIGVLIEAVKTQSIQINILQIEIEKLKK